MGAEEVKARRHGENHGIAPFLLAGNGKTAIAEAQKRGSRKREEVFMENIGITKPQIKQGKRKVRLQGNHPEHGLGKTIKYGRRLLMINYLKGHGCNPCQEAPAKGNVKLQETLA